MRLLLGFGVLKHDWSGKIRRGPLSAYESFTSILLGTGVLIVFVAIWFGATLLFIPHMDNPDGYAKITGNYGDTMEIGLKIKEGIVHNTHSWTDGCSMSKLCVEAAVRLAQRKDIASLKKLNIMIIMVESL